ncbi:ABC transporter ATP-binding protein [Mesorhizobium sp. CA8]|uniref:ABC transporter ATP-binding protein n=1 Tax=unclassified Mesorhizobium TaxID=325217 RepID=UPI001CD02C18|nr:MULTISPECIES: ABC transporter ATP-binding protein [unclassified Mesorhizobium]MBZ9761663.1 ABC transporter ATP-binding protein [Mesorhizobium sp. CA8]MBZ9820583.1 ABC transporter ATP-binding protein [Mesorhizobium sp. CA4]
MRRRDQGQPGSVLIDIKGLVVKAATEEGTTTILNGVDLTVHRGEVVGLIGESGAGKSTLGLACMGFTRGGVRFTAGSIHFDGVDITRLQEKELRENWGTRVAYVAQSAAAAFNPAWRLLLQTTETAVDQHIMTRFDARAKAVDLYRTMRLPAPERIGERFPHQVSGGQLQRAMVAMGMVCQPDLLIFDEPTTALDVTTQIEVLAAIREVVQRYNTAAVYVTHDLAVVAQMAHRIAVMRHGQVVEFADTRKLLSSPEHPYTRELLNVTNIPREPGGETGAEVVLTIKNVNAQYGAQKVLDDVSFNVRRGETVALVGESGSGKSTTARVITGLLAPTDGEVLFKALALPASYRNRTRDLLRQIQLVSQMPDTALNPRHTVRQVLSRPLKFYFGMTGAKCLDRVEELLRMIEMDPETFLDRRSSELSGGQKQRLCIARALAANPSVLICDEVTSALDRLVAKEILQLLLKLQQQLKVAMIFITHDLEVVRAIAHDVVVMKTGRVVEAGPIEKVFAPPHDPYTELLLSSVPQMDPDWLSELLGRRAAKAPDGDVAQRSNVYALLQRGTSPS